MIYVITHKVIEDDSYIDYDHYKVLHVGTNNNCMDSYIRDDAGDNISKKNGNYCELTGLYWIWNNAEENDNDVTGLVHYRRFFTTYCEDFKYKYLGIVPKNIPYSRIFEAMTDHDMIIPKKIFVFSTLKSFYGKFHDIDDINKIRELIKNKYPDYLVSFDKVINSHSYTYGNMMICKKKTLDLYSKWLFDIMFDFENVQVPSLYSGDAYQSRIYGFLSERLLQVWIEHNNLRYVEFPVFNVESRTLNIFDVTRLRVETLLRKLKQGK